MERFLHKSKYIDRLISALEEQKVLMESELILALIGASFIADEVQDIASEAGLKLLIREDIDQSMKDYLGSSYEPFRKVLAKCERILTGLAKSIGNLTTNEVGIFLP